MITEGNGKSREAVSWVGNWKGTEAVSWRKIWKERALSRGWEMVREDNQKVEAGNRKEERQ
jgi:hypothetical protein